MGTSEKPSIHRIYTNCRWSEFGEPDGGAKRIDISLWETRLVVERRSIRTHPYFDEDGEDEGEADDRERTETAFATRDAARAAFDAEVVKLAPRIAIDAPAGEDGELAWVGPRDEDDHWMRADDCARETAEDVAPVRGDTDDEVVVLADWQLAHADPHIRARGELASLQRGGAARSERACELLVAYADAWLDGLLAVAEIGFRGGFVDTVRLAPDGSQHHAGTVTPGFLTAFLRLPIAARVRRLVLGPVGYWGCTGNGYVDSDSLLAAICESRPPALRDLELAGVDFDDGYAPIEQLPNLERLTIRGSSYPNLADLASASLRELVLLDGTHVDNVAGIQCPRLETLIARLEVRDLDRFLASDLPIRRWTYEPQTRRNVRSPTGAWEEIPTTAAEILSSVAGSTLVARLDELVIGGASPEAARDAIAAAASQLAHLKRFVVEGLGAQPSRRR